MSNGTIEPVEPAQFPSGDYPWYFGLIIRYGVYGGMCDLAIEFPNGYELGLPLLSLFSLIALIIGLYCSSRIWASKLPSRRFYGITFFTYGVMMTSAMFADSIIPGFHSKARWLVILEGIVGWIDGSLTSSIAISFGFNGLADVGLINEGSKKSTIAMALTYISIFGAWFFALFLTTDPSFGWQIYFWTCLLGPSVYIACELVYLFFQGHTDGVGYLVVAALAGAAGLHALLDYPGWLCYLLTPWLGNSEWWFLFSDVAMFAIYKFFMVNHAAMQRQLERPSEPSADEEELQPLVVPEAPTPLAPVYLPKS